MSGRLSVLPVRDRSEIRRFVDVAYHLRHDEPRWVPPLRSDATARVRLRRNPFWRRADGRLFIARRAQRMVGRISLQVDAVEQAERGSALFGFFECEDDATTARALVDAARAFAAAEGARTVVGPASFTALEEAGVLVEGFDEPASFLAPWHPPYYRELLEDLGGRPLDEITTVRIPLAGTAPPSEEPPAEEAGDPPRVSEAARAVTELAGDLDTLVPGSAATWLPTLREVKARFRRLRPLIDRDLLEVVSTAGRVRGVAVAVPDLNEVLARLQQGLGPVNVARLVREARRSRAGATVALLAGDPARLLPGLASRAARAGYEHLEYTATEASPARRVGEGLGGETVRRYRTFGFPVSG